MKELSIEKKAKRYDEALEKARNIVNSINVGLIGKDSFEVVFPELKESEDERIRKELIAHFKTNSVSESWSGLNVKKVIAWLEKQGEQKCNEEYNITGIKSKNAEGKLGEMIMNLKSVNEVLEQKPAWSEEDKKMFVNIKACLRNANKDYSREVDWLKSIKPQPKNEWSEEDEKRIKKVMHILSLDGRISNKELESIFNWLKALRPQKQWKPSEEQLRELENVFSPDTDSWDEDILRKLYEQLKQL